MTAAGKAKAVNYGLFVAGLGFVTGGMLSCACPGWFFCAGLAAVAPAVWGLGWTRLFGVLLCAANCIAGVGQTVEVFHERGIIEKVRRIKERNAEPRTKAENHARLKTGGRAIHFTFGFSSLNFRRSSLMTESEKRERARLDDEVRLASRLTDADRARIFDDLLRTADAIQKTKSAEQLQREEEVRRVLDETPGRQRYFELMDRLL
jgi:hypothetical protein